MPADSWYLDKADRCARQATETADPCRRAEFEHEAKLWRAIAHDIVKRDQATRPI